MKLSFHTSQRQSPGYTSLQLDIAYTNGALDETHISDACELAINTFVNSISSHIVEFDSKERRLRAEQEASVGDSLDEILEQVLRQGSHLSTV